MLICFEQCLSSEFLNVIGKNYLLLKIQIEIDVIPWSRPWAFKENVMGMYQELVTVIISVYKRV